MTKKTEEKEPSAQTSEPSAEVPPSAPEKDVDAIQQQLQQALNDAKKWEEEAKAHQKVASRKEADNKKLEEKLNALSDKIELLTTAYSSQGSDELDLTAKLKEIDQKREKERFDAIVREADELIRESGMDWDKTPELHAAYVKFAKGDPEGGYKEVAKVVEAKKKAPEEKPREVNVEEEAKKLAEKMHRDWLEEKGYLTPEGTPPAGGGSRYTREQVSNFDLRGKTPQELKEFAQSILDQISKK